MKRIMQKANQIYIMVFMAIFLLIVSLPSDLKAYQFGNLASNNVDYINQVEVNEKRDKTLTVTVDVKNIKLSDLLDNITRQADVGLSYDAEIDIDKLVTVKATDRPFFTLLDELLTGTNLNYSVSEDRNVLFMREKKNVVKEEEFQETVTGRVVDAETGESLPGVNIRVNDANRGVTTNSEGDFTFSNINEGDQLIFSFIGYKEKKIIVHNSEIDLVIQLYPVASELSEIVVTALNMDRERTRLGYSLQMVNGLDLSNSSESNLVNTLSGRVSGVNVTSASGNIGSSSRIVIRGENSISGNNQPLFVIDGTPVDNSNIKSGTGGSFRPDAGGTSSAVDFGNAISDLNPDDIESISVLKGPNAAALYGSRAANGVIQIKTKDGQGVDGYRVTVNSRVAFLRPSTLPDYQNEYGQGNGDYFEYVDGANGVGDGTDSSFGPPLDQGLEFIQFNSNGELAPWVSHPDNVKDFFETGAKVSNNVSISGGSEDINFRLSMTNSNEKGMVPNTDLGRNNISLNINTALMEKLNVRSSVNYIKTNSGNRMGGGYDDQNVMKQFMWFGRQVDIPALKDQYKKYGNDMNWNTSWNSNPYFMLYENTNSLDRDRLIGNISLRYNFTDQMSLSLTAGNDFYSDVRSLRRAYNDFEFPNGAFTEDTYKISEQNYDALLKRDQYLSPDLSLSLSVGGSWLLKTMRQNMVQANQLAVPGVYNVGNALGIPTARNWYQEKQLYSMYGLMEINFRDYLFVEITGRNDWSSTLPLDNNSYFYPSVSLSGVLSELFDLEDSFIEYAKIRASYAQVGSDTEPYQISSVYNSSVSSWGSLTTVTEANTIPNTDLEPQLTNSYEVGADFSLFDGRASFDFTWYDSYTENQIISSSISNSSGYSQRFFNAGKIKNTGIEFSAFLKPLSRTSAIQWDIDINYARNKNEVLELAEGVDRLQLSGGGLFGVDVVAVEGEPYGSLYGRGMKRNEDGEVIFGSNGLPELTDTGKIQGNYQPDWTGGISNTFRFNGFSLSTLITGSFGGQIYSGTNVVGRRAGILASTLPGREVGIIGDGVVRNEDGTYSPNTTKVDASRWYGGYYAYANTEVSIFDSNYIKVREASLFYTLPSNLLQLMPVRSINLGLVGRNLFFLYNSVPNIDPETAISNDLPQGLEVGQIPSARSISVNVSISF